MERNARLKNTSIAAALAFYCAISLVPFYFLVIRSFTPTLNSSQFYFWIPERPEVQMNARIGNLASVNNVDITALKRDLGLKGYIDPRLTLDQIATRQGIDPGDLEEYLRPFIQYNGFFVVLSNGFLKSLWGTIVVAGSAVAIGGFLGIMTGTALAGFRRPWHLFVYNSYLLNMIVPPMMVILPQYFIVTQFLGLQNSYFAIVLLHIKGGALSTMVFTTYIAAIPKSLRESVQMDGGRHYHYFWYIVLPLMGTPFAIFASIMMPLFWNDLLHGLLFLSPDKYTLPAFVATLGGAYGRNFEAVFSGVLMSLIPILVVYFIFQKLFIRSAMAGAVKG